jgi:hypothetical protein
MIQLKLLKMRKQELFSQQSPLVQSLTRQHCQDQDASGGSVVVADAVTAAILWLLR